MFQGETFHTVDDLIKDFVTKQKPVFFDGKCVRMHVSYISSPHSCPSRTFFLRRGIPRSEDDEEVHVQLCPACVTLMVVPRRSLRRSQFSSFQWLASSMRLPRADCDVRSDGCGQPETEGDIARRIYTALSESEEERAFTCWLDQYDLNCGHSSYVQVYTPHIDVRGGRDARRQAAGSDFKRTGKCFH